MNDTLANQAKSIDKKNTVYLQSYKNISPQICLSKHTHTHTKSLREKSLCTAVIPTKMGFTDHPILTPGHNMLFSSSCLVLHPQYCNKHTAVCTKVILSISLGSSHFSHTYTLCFTPGNKPTHRDTIILSLSRTHACMHTHIH